MTTINNNINSLDPQFLKKFTPRWKEVKQKYPNAQVFEARRSPERQKRLYASGRTRQGPIVTWTLNSKHLEGKAVDIVFYKDNKPTRQGPYDELTKLATKYGIKNLYPLETCHYEDDGTPYKELLDPLLQRLIDDGIWNGDYGTLDQRMVFLVAKLYSALKSK